MRGQTHEFYNLGDARRARADNLTIRYRKNQIDVRFSSHVEKKQEKPLGRGHLNFRIACIKAIKIGFPWLGHCLLGVLPVWYPYPCITAQMSEKR